MDEATTPGNGQMPTTFQQTWAQDEEILLRKEEQKRLNRLLKQAPVGMCLLRGEQFVVELANNRMLDLWERTAGEMLNKPLFDVLAHAKNGRFEELLTGVYRTGIAFVGNETPIERIRDGSKVTIYVNFVYEPLYEDGRNISGIIVVATDVTEQVEARRKIDENDERWTITAIAADFGLWDFDVLQQKVIATGKMAEIYGLDNNSQYATEHLLTAIHPEDRQEQDQLFAAIIEGKVSKSFQTEYRIIRKNTGAVGWIRARGKAFINEQGVLYRTVGTVFDITAKKEALQKQRQAEDELRRSEERFRAFVTASSDMVFRMNADWTEMLELHGHGFLSGKGEPVADWIEKYIHPTDKKLVLKHFKKAIATKTMFELEHTVLLANGSTGWMFSRAVPIFDADGNIKEWFGTACDITERRKTEEQLRLTRDELDAEKRLYDAITGSTPDLIYVFDLHARFIYANKALLTMWGLSWEDSVGKKPLEIGYEPWHAEMHEREISEVAATKKPVRGEVSFVHATQGRRIYDYIFAPVFDDHGTVIAIAGTTRDISDLKMAEEALKRSEEQFRTLTQSLPQLIWTATPAGNLDFFNKQWFDYTGSKCEESLNTEWTQFIHPDNREDLLCRWADCLREGASLTYEFRLRATDGSYNWFYVLGNPIHDADGNILKWVGALTNIEEQKAVEDNLELLVQERTKELQRSNGDLLQFAHVASHDLKEPVRKVKLFAGLVGKDAESQLSARGQEYLRKINSASDRMFYMIEGVLSYSTVNRSVQDFSEVSLIDTITNIVTDLEVVIAQKQATIRYEDLPSVYGAQVLIYQLFYNLIANSLKFARAGEPPVIHIYATTTLVAGRPVAAIQLTDNGIGFGTEHAERIFETFTRLHSKDEYEGTGLGLALCKKIVERHNGSIVAESEEGVGATFTVTLPASKNEALPGYN